jgi:hypothetical protein
MCDGFFSRRDKRDPKLSSADTTVTMMPAAQESFKQRRKFKDVKKNAKRWSKKVGASSFSEPTPAKKAKSGVAHMITTSDTLDDDSTERPSKTVCVASPDVEDADHSEDDDSDDAHQLEDTVSSSKSGGVTSCSKSDDKTRGSTKTRLKARGPGFTPVLRPEEARDFYDTHLMVRYVYTGPISSTKKSSEASAATKPPPSAAKKKVHHLKKKKINVLVKECFRAVLLKPVEGMRDRWSG